jgi:hypothetical protein
VQHSQAAPSFVPELPAELERRVGGQGDLHPGDGLGRVPVTRERVRTDLDVQLHARARRFRGDAARMGEQMLGTVDGDTHILTAGREDLLVQHPVTVIGRQRLLMHVLLGQRGRMPTITRPLPVPGSR